MKTRWYVPLLAAGILWLQGCGGGPAALEAEDPAAAERAQERKLRDLMMDAQEAFAMPDLDEGAADEDGE